MNINKIMLVSARASVVMWSFVCLVIFMYYPGALSQIHDVSFYDNAISKITLSRISPIKFVSDTLLAFWGMVFFGIACIALGRRVISLFFQRSESLADQQTIFRQFLPTYFLVGNTVFSVVLLLVAATTTLTWKHSLIILSLGFLSGAGQLKGLHNFVSSDIKHTKKLFLILTLVILAGSLFQSSARISYDASSTYFSLAKLTAINQQAEYFLDNTFVASISQSTILYAAIIQLFGDQSARMISWLLGAVTIYLSVELARLIGASKSARSILPILILTSTAFLDLMGDGKVDLFSSAYALAGIYWLLKTGEINQGTTRSLFVLSGYFTGFACILRPNNVFLLGLFFLVYFLQQWKNGRLTIVQVFQHTWWIFLGAVFLAVYHLVINKIIMGSPFAFWSVVTKINPVDGPWDYNPDIVWVYRFLYPLVVTFKNSGASLGNISPLVLVFLPFLMFTVIRSQITPTESGKDLYFISATVLLAWIFLFFTVVEVRYVFFLWIILYIPIAEIIARMLVSPSVILQKISITCVVLLAGFILARSIYISISTYSPVDKFGNPHCYDIEYCDQIGPINEAAKLGERVLVLNPFRYYLRTDLFTCSTKGDEYRRLQETFQTGEVFFWEEVYRQGYHYIAFDINYSKLHLNIDIIPNPDSVPNWMELKMLYGSPDHITSTYKINILSPPPVEIENKCSLTSNGWKTSTFVEKP